MYVVATSVVAANVSQQLQPVLQLGLQTLQDLIFCYFLSH